MAWDVRLAKKAEKDLANLSAKYRKKVLIVLLRLVEDPFFGKKLDGELKGLYSCRVWPYRIIYKVYKTDLVVIIIRIGHRQGIY